MTQKKYKFTLGKDYIYHCKTCNVPLIGKYCGICQKKGTLLRISPPGDIRLANKKSIEIIKNFFQENYGVEFIDEKIVLLNGIAGMDRTDEIILDGRIIGVLYFDLKAMEHKVDLSLVGAKILSHLNSRKIVVINKLLASQYLKDKNVLKKDILEFDKDIKVGDDVIVRIGGLIGLGKVKEDLNTENAKIKIRDISAEDVKLIEKKSTIQDMINANASFLESAEKNAIEELQKNFKIEMPITVSFSGGEDSLVALEIAKKATDNFEVFFVNTGLEFPETIEYVKEYCNDVIIADAGNSFWENIDDLGVPAKDFRWCCKLCKLAPLSELIEKRYPSGCYTIEGRRRFEIFARARVGAVEKNPFVPNQFLLNPIRNWKALDVFLYILWKGLPYNKLYDEDYQRIGCFLCPSLLASEFENMKETHPELYKKWKEKLYKWAEESKLSKEYVDKGFWRWILLPPKMMLLAKELGLEIKRRREGKMKLVSAKGVVACSTGGYSIDAVLTIPTNYSYHTVANALNMITPHVFYSEDLGVISLRGREFSAKVFASGHICVVSPKDRRTKEIFEFIVKTILRVQLCSQCEICVKTCRTHAIRLKEGTIIVDRNRCHQCLKCYEGCVVAKHYDKLVEEWNKKTIT